MPPVIISLHVPKAAGTSLLTLLRRKFGEEGVLQDYADDPANPASGYFLDPQSWLEQRPTSLPAGCRAVHGHFHASKYDRLAGAFRFTFLRHPVENMLSIFSYWRRIPPQPSPLHQYFLREDLDILGLARLPLLRYLYTRTYFGGWDMGRMDHVGRHETRAEGLRRLGETLGVELDASLHLNSTHADGNAERESLRADAQLMARLTDLLADDLHFYETYAR